MHSTETIQDRARAGKLLSRKLRDYADAYTVITGVTRGGVLVAAAVAEELDLPLEVIPCRKIKHPADNTRSLGSVCGNDVITHQEYQDIPQDYICHQVNMIRYALALESKYFYGDGQPASFQNKTVIVVDDWVQSGDTLAACLNNILKQKPRKLIAAVPFISTKAARLLQGIADELIYLHMDRSVRPATECFLSFPSVSLEEVKASLKKFKDSRTTTNG
ncbi:MAG TPA: phosphoribosyltransferase family protein [Ohtaekwangia sp.]|uniref:phosphoribosyltransferase family protein n=1 Tax=Ohtaekwangia sp. TaxID=2066019 RepID=UPI002F9516BE